MSSSTATPEFPGFDTLRIHNEYLYWAAKPRFVPFILKSFINSFFVIGFAVFWLSVTRPSDKESGNQASWLFTLLGLLPLLLVVFQVVSKLIGFPATWYGYTDRRILIKNGGFSTAFVSLDYAQLISTEVSVSAIEKLFGVGTIRFFSGKTTTDDNVSKRLYDEWVAIPEPYAVLKALQEQAAKQPRR